MSNLETLVNEMSTEEYIKLFDFGTDGKYQPDEKTKELTDEEILKELGL
jgi:hypothetical protein